MLTGELKPLAELVDRLPRRNGRKVHRNTLHRWIRRGCRGIRLEARPVGGIWYSTVEAIEQFSDALLRRAEGNTLAPAIASRPARRRQIAAARSWLKEEGVYGGEVSSAPAKIKWRQVPDLRKTGQLSRPLPALP